MGNGRYRIAFEGEYVSLTWFKVVAEYQLIEVNADIKKLKLVKIIKNENHEDQIGACKLFCVSSIFYK